MFFVDGGAKKKDSNLVLRTGPWEQNEFDRLKSRMGNQSSSEGAGRQPVRTCYYELLEVDQTSTSDE
jgi:hypothetical protein